MRINHFDVTDKFNLTSYARQSIKTSFIMSQVVIHTHHLLEDDVMRPYVVVIRALLREPYVTFEWVRGRRSPGKGTLC